MNTEFDAEVVHRFAALGSSNVKFIHIATCMSLNKM